MLNHRRHAEDLKVVATHGTSDVVIAFLAFEDVVTLEIPPPLLDRFCHLETT